MLERIAARCAELDGLEEQLVKQLSEVRAEREELAAAERVWRDQRLADMAGGNDISALSVRRRRAKLIALLDARAPRLDRALKKIAKRGGELVLIDGTPIPTQRRAPARRTARTIPAGIAVPACTCSYDAAPWEADQLPERFTVPSARLLSA